MLRKAMSIDQFLCDCRCFLDNTADSLVDERYNPKLFDKEALNL